MPERPCVLVVDDNPHDREIYGRTLCYNGFDVVFAWTGAGALKIASTQRVDLVLLDLGLPDMQGLDVVRALRRQPGFGATPVIALSAFARWQMGEPAERAGCHQYIEKPANPVAVLHAVESMIGRAPKPGVGRPPHAEDPPLSGRTAR
jgi:CheY-like chemotaxis protein